MHSAVYSAVVFFTYHFKTRLGFSQSTKAPLELTETIKKTAMLEEEDESIDQLMTNLS